MSVGWDMGRGWCRAISTRRIELLIKKAGLKRTQAQAAARSYRIGLGPRRGKKVFTLRTEEADEEGGSNCCVQNNGFSLHAGVSCEANERKKLERLCRYVARPAIANDRMKLTDCGQVVFQLKTAFRDGATHIVMSPLELLQKLAALVPRPRLNLVRFHGVLAPNAKWRSQVVPDPNSETEERIEPSSTEAGVIVNGVNWIVIIALLLPRK